MLASSRDLLPPRTVFSDEEHRPPPPEGTREAHRSQVSEGKAVRGEVLQPVQGLHHELEPVSKLYLSTPRQDLYRVQQSLVTGVNRQQKSPERA